jgi:hypothetical protein
MYVDLGVDGELRRETPEKYWKEVASKLREFVDRDTVNSLSGVFLHGESATDPQLLEVLKEIFDPNDALKEENYVHTTEKHLFAAAHGAAMSARDGMETGFLLCIVSDYYPRLKDEL